MIQKIVKALQVLGVLIFLIILSFPLIIMAGYQLKYKNKVYPNIRVLDLNLGGQTQSRALDLLTRRLENKNFSNLKITYKTLGWDINLNDLNFQYLPEKTVAKAYSLGKNENWIKDPVNQLKSFKNGAQLSLDYQLDYSQLQAQIATIAAIVNVPTIPPTIKVINENEKQIEIEKGMAGRKVDQQALLHKIDQRLGSLDTEAIELPITTIEYLKNESEVENIKNRAKKLLNKKIVLEFQNQSWDLTEKELINFLSFDGSGFDDHKIASYSSQLASYIDQPAENALFNFISTAAVNNGGRVEEFKPAQDGQSLDQEKTNQQLFSALDGLENNANTVVKISLPVELTQPEVETKDVNNLGIKELIGKGESWYGGSISSRVYNLNLAAQRINGLLLAPEEVFSFNQALGDVSAQTGYKQAYIIKDGRTILGDGGGVCQVSTTLFRAALNAGLPIVERSAHAYRVSYYEQSSQVGLDATVYDPRPDLKIKNDTGNYILIQADSDPKNYYLAFFLYGTWDGRKAIISESRMWDQVPPPPDLYQDDPNLAVGTVKQIDWKSWGAKVAFDWRVVRGNDVLQERTFYSNYRPWQAVFLKGTAEQ
jgi:vancomycin resistance protein YoaR